MNSKELIQSIKNLRSQDAAGSPDRDFIAKNREILMMQVKNNSVPTERPFSFNYILRLTETLLPANLFKFVVRPVALALLVFGVAFGGWAATVSASYDSLPGDTLYTFKRMAENAQVSLASKEDKPSLHVEFATRRLEEVAKIAEKGDFNNKEERARQAVNNFTEQVQAVKTTLENMSDKQEPGKAVEIAQMVDRKTTEYASVLEKTIGSMPGSDIAKEVLAASSAVSDAGIKAIEVIIRKSEGSAAQINQEEMVNKVEEKIKIVEQSVSQMSDSTSTIASTVKKDAKGYLTEAKEAMEGNNLGAVVDKLIEVKNLVNTVVAEVVITSSSTLPSGNSTSTNK